MATGILASELQEDGPHSAAPRSIESVGINWLLKPTNHQLNVARDLLQEAADAIGRMVVLGPTGAGVGTDADVRREGARLGQRITRALMEEAKLAEL